MLLTRSAHVAGRPFADVLVHRTSSGLRQNHVDISDACSANTHHIIRTPRVSAYVRRLNAFQEQLQDFRLLVELGLRHAQVGLGLEIVDLS
jgi:hypothetical protein